MGLRTGITRAGVAALLAALVVALVPVVANAEDASEPPPSPATTTTTITSPPPSTTTTSTTVPDDGEQETPPAADDGTTDLPPNPAPDQPEPETVEPTPPPPPKKKIFFTPVKRIDAKRDIVFPIVGKTRFWGGFGDCRDNCQREHFGVDILTYGWKGLPVVAAQDGTVTKVTYDVGKAGCSIRIRGRDRWQTRYIHLNNDTPGTDGTGYPCPAPGIEVGSKVTAGQIIGWVGDSGNAEDGQPNIHFELRTPGGYPVDPYKSLRAARNIEYEWLPQDMAGTLTILSGASQPQDSTMAIIVDAREAGRLIGRDATSSTYNAPVLAIDRSDPTPTILDLQRLGIQRVVVMTEGRDRWIEELVGPYVLVAETSGFPRISEDAMSLMPDEDLSIVFGDQQTGRFTTVISGAVDRLPRSYRTTYEIYIDTHRSVVLTSSARGSYNLGVRIRNRPSRNADRSLLWWNTADGWIGTALLDDIPDSGIAYLTERMATPWTLTFLESLKRYPPMPVWRSS